MSDATQLLELFRGGDGIDGSRASWWVIVDHAWAPTIRQYRATFYVKRPFADVTGVAADCPPFEDEWYEEEREYVDGDAKHWSGTARQSTWAYERWLAGSDVDVPRVYLSFDGARVAFFQEMARISDKAKRTMNRHAYLADESVKWREPAP